MAGPKAHRGSVLPPRMCRQGRAAVREVRWKRRIGVSAASSRDFLRAFRRCGWPIPSGKAREEDRHVGTHGLIGQFVSCATVPGRRSADDGGRSVCPPVCRGLGIYDACGTLRGWKPGGFLFSAAEFKSACGPPGPGLSGWSGSFDCQPSRLTELGNRTCYLECRPPLRRERLNR